MDISLASRYLKGMQSLMNYFWLPFWEVDSEKAKLHWLVRLRWLALVFLTLIAVPAFVNHFLDARTLPIFLGAVGILMGFNLLTQGFWLLPTSRKIGFWFLLMQVCLDLIVFTGLLMLSGGMGNPFYLLFYVNMSLGAVLLSDRRGFFFLLLGHFFLAFVQLSTFWGDFIPWVPLSVQHLVLFLSFMVSRSLGRVLARQQEKLLQTRVQAEKMDRLRALGALSAGFSHEFASPLTALRLRLERETKKNNSFDLAEALAALKDCEKVLYQMNQSQLDARAHQPQKFHLEQKTEEIVHAWKQQHPEARLEIASESIGLVEIPLVNFTQSLVNFLDNAFQAAPSGQIHLHLLRSEDEFIVQISDEGPGFSEEVLQRFGEPFVTTKVAGTGLGLYSAHLFAQSLGGRVQIQNLARGASVGLRVPLSHGRSLDA